jgi:5,5'-dehydrodivanillate O-demethylase
MASASDLKFADLEQVGPGTPAGRYLRLFWQPVFRARDLPNGKARPLEILGEKFTLYRGEDGIARITGFRCAHRGTQLSLGWVEGDSLRCRYHGWKFDGAGQCVEQPNEDKPFCARVKIPTYPACEYAGLVFAYFGEDTPPTFPLYPNLEVPGVVVTDPAEIIPCSFWNRLDNDVSHIPWVHRATALRKGRPDYMVSRGEVMQETPYGWISNRTLKGNNSGAMRDLPQTAYYFMPQLLQFSVRTRARGFEDRNLWDTKLTWTVPINDGAFVAFDVTHTPLAGEEARAYAASRSGQQEPETESRWDLAKRVLAGEMTLEEIPDELSAYTSFEIEDYVTQVGQGSIAERGREQLARTDAKPLMIRRLWLREIRALLEGSSLTEWQIPSTALPVDGSTL